MVGVGYGVVLGAFTVQDRKSWIFPYCFLQAKLQKLHLVQGIVGNFSVVQFQRLVHFILQALQQLWILGQLIDGKGCSRSSGLLTSYVEYKSLSGDGLQRNCLDVT